MTQDIQIKRAYDPPSENDGLRIYIDRLWPRGLSHETFHFDLWDKEIAPTTELREWFHQDPIQRWDDFYNRYTAELLDNPAFISLKKEIYGKPTITLLYSSHDKVHNNAVIVAALLKKDK